MLEGGEAHLRGTMVPPHRAPGDHLGKGSGADPPVAGRPRQEVTFARSSACSHSQAATARLGGFVTGSMEMLPEDQPAGTRLTVPEAGSNRLAVVSTP
jgi:hypothetical protein